jgi:prepilin-type N-terminal cleavage/methylation domain-containing protein
MTDKNQEKFLAETMRRGFTLVELLVVVAILGILGTIGLQGVTKHIENTRKTAAKTAVDNIRGAVTAYMIGEKKSIPPSDLKVVIEPKGDEDPYLEGGEGALVDPWDNDYRIEVKGKRFVVISNGPDGSPNTEDDIRSDKIEKTKDK